MTAFVFALVLATAVIHAGWNVIVKGSDDKLATAVAICVGASLIALLFLPFVTVPAAASWPYMGITLCLQAFYYMLFTASYGRIDMSLAYPVMRGGGPMMVAVMSGLVFHESLGGIAWIGVLLICGGILSMASFGHGGSRAGLGFAVLNAIVIALYTLSDGRGVRLSGGAAGYAMWIFFLTSPAILVWSMAVRGPGFLPQVARRWKDGLIGGVGTMLSYGGTLWAMTQAPVAMVAALRETSILFGLALSAFLLKEHVGHRKIIAAALIVAGAVTLRLG